MCCVMPPASPRDHVGLADRVEQRRLAVVDVAHDGDDRRTRLQRLVDVGRVEQALLDVRLRDALDGVAELLGDELGGVGVDHVGDLRELALLHQHADHVHAALRHAVGELLDGDRLGDDDLAGDLLLRLRGLVPLRRCARRRKDATERMRSSCSPVAVVTVRRPRIFAVGGLGPLGLGRRDDLGRQSGTPDDALLVFLRLRRARRAAGPADGATMAPVGRRLGGGRRGARTRLAGLVAEAALGLVLGLALDLFVGGGDAPRRACAPRRPRARSSRALRARRGPCCRSRPGGARPPRGGAPRPGRVARASRSSSVRVRSTTPLGRWEAMLAGRCCCCAGAARPEPDGVGVRRGAAHAGGAQRPPAPPPRSRRGAHGRRGRCRRMRLRLAFARSDDAALHLLDHDRLAAAVREALAHDALLDRALQAQASWTGR